ncbi:MAG: hypothetical protein RR446_12005, partial [Lachnospiraceae bacterium]
VDQDGKVSIVGAGTTEITVALTETDNYFAAAAKVSVTVKKKAGTLMVSKLTYELTYGDADFTIADITKEGESEVTFTSSKEDVATVDSTGKVSMKGVGETIIKLDMAESNNYNAVSNQVTVKVKEATPVITLADAALTYTEATAAYSGSVALVKNEMYTGTIDYSYRTNGSTDKFTNGLPTNVGTYEVKAEIAAFANYNAASKTAVLTIKAKDITGAAVTLGDVLRYNGKEQTQSIHSIVADGITLTTKDYEVTGDKATNAGVHTMTITGNGNFTGTITQKYIVVAEDNSLDNNMGDGKVNLEVNVDQNAPDMTISNSKADMIQMVVSADELAAVADGETINIYMEVKDISDTVPAEDKAKIEAAAGEDTTIMYLDISLFKKLGNQDAQKVANTNGKMTVSIKIPNSLITQDAGKTRTYKIMQVHEGKLDIIEGTYDAATGLFTFQIDKFSTYAITYVDTTNPTTPDPTNPAQPTTTPTKPITSDTSPTTGVKTGDSTNMKLWMILMVVTGGTALILTWIRKKKEKQE